MQRSLLKSKLHRVVVTQSELHYEGSCAIDENLLEAADIREFEQIEIYNVNNGERLSTYAIRAARNSGTISVNGAAARKAALGDLLIIASYGAYTEDEVRVHRPTLIYVDARNRAVSRRDGIPAQAAAPVAVPRFRAVAWSSTPADMDSPAWAPDHPIRTEDSVPFVARTSKLGYVPGRLAGESMINPRPFGIRRPKELARRG